jgi:hypothetical protein
MDDQLLQGLIGPTDSLLPIAPLLAIHYSLFALSDGIQ